MQISNEALKVLVHQCVHGFQWLYEIYTNASFPSAGTRLSMSRNRRLRSRRLSNCRRHIETLTPSGRMSWERWTSLHMPSTRPTNRVIDYSKEPIVDLSWFERLNICDAVLILQPLPMCSFEECKQHRFSGSKQTVLLLSQLPAWCNALFVCLFNWAVCI